jgi:pimeloyl-ACP methyl ester carboxylesterase
MNEKSKIDLNGRTAFLVIHGIGEQSPFETLDQFASGLLPIVQDLRGKQPIRVRHCINDFKTWTESYVSLELDRKGRDHIDIYEYYWANKTERLVALPDIMDWLVAASKGAANFYQQNKKYIQKYEGPVKVFDKTEFVELSYLNAATPYLRWLGFLNDALPSKVAWWLQPILNYFKRALIDYVGDIVVYTSTDIKSKFYETRKAILDEAVDAAVRLLKNPKYKKVVLVGHSLGSVIGFDVLNRINIAINLRDMNLSAIDKIGGFVTFGSPLDKTAFFFRQRAQEGQDIRQQIIDHFDSFKVRAWDVPKYKVDLSDPIQPLLDEVPWLNFYDERDWVSGHLDFYGEVKNVRLDSRLENPVEAHEAYWKNSKMFEEMLRFLF